MSLLLDQHLVGEVAEYCPAEFIAYYSCLGKGSAAECLDEQKRLGLCAKTKAPSFIKIVNSCTDHMNAYEACIRENADFKTKCFDLLKQMRDCTTRAVGMPDES